MIRRTWWSPLLIGLLVTFSSATLAADGHDASEDALTLERFFPEKGLFGPSASQTSFSFDGRYGAYLYRPNLERRHGSDLWIYDTRTGETRRITSVSVLAEFQEQAREVREDRVKKAKKRGSKQDDGAAQVDRAALQDAIGGMWSGRLTGGEEAGLPARGLAFSLTLMVDEDGSITGELSHANVSGSGRSTARVQDISFDQATGTLTATLVSSEFSIRARLNGTIDGETISGTLEVRAMDLTLTLEGARTSAGGPVAMLAEPDDELQLGDLVDDDDADDDDAPRYSGVSTYVWSPTANEIIFTAEGDLYMLDVAADTIERLTRTEQREFDVQYLPDGSGYTYRRDTGIVKMTFGSHVIEQINPKLDDGRRMSQYSISPDGRRLAILATKGESYWSKGRTVNIVNYRDRFAAVRQVSRHVSDDPMPDYEWSVHLFDLDDHFNENAAGAMVLTHKQSGPRDVVTVPSWAPDSSRAAFSVYEQSSGQVEMFESRFDEPTDEVAEADTDEAGEADDAENTEDDDDEQPSIHEARLIYKFYHHGGPTTPRMVMPYYLHDSQRIAFITELSGFRHLHVLDPVYEHLEQRTTGRYEVYPIDVCSDHQTLFVTATKDDPAQQHVFAIDLESGEMTQLSENEGVYDRVAVSDDASHVLASRIDFGSPRELVAIDRSQGTELALTDSHTEEARELAGFQPEYFTFENRHGHTIHGHMFKPDDWSEDDQRPLLVYIYGGPLGTRKMITRGAFSAPSYFFAYYMAKKHGYVTCTIDPRGASGYGALFEKSNYEQVGKPQVEDIVDCAHWFVEHHGVDAERMGLHGWSFGGFQTQMCDLHRAGRVRLWNRRRRPDRVGEL